MTHIDEIAAHFADARPNQRGGYDCLCPAHEDRKSSLSIGKGEDGRILLHCFAGCDFEDVLAAAGLSTADLRPTRAGRRGTAGTGNELWDATGIEQKAQSRKQKLPLTNARKSGKGKPWAKIVAAYDYVNAAGELVFQAVRMEPKSFRQRRPDGAGGWVWNLQGVERVPYRLPEVLAAIARGELIYVAEGEKDVHSLEALGLVATCNAGGAGKFGAAEAQYFKGARVAILPDNDDPGRAGAQKTAAALAGNADEIRIVNLPGLPQKGDVTDWIDVGGTAADLAALVDLAPVWTAAAIATSKAKKANRSKSKSKAEKSPVHPEVFRENGAVIPLAVAQMIATEHPTLVALNGDYWEFSGKIYKKIAPEDVSNYITDIILDKSNKRVCEDVHYILRAKLKAADDYFAPDPARIFLLALDNGMLDIATGELLPHEPKYRMRVLLPPAYDPQARCPRFEEALEQWLPDDPQARDLLVEWLGYCLVPDMSQCQALWLFGEGANGKGCFAKVLENLIGRENYAAVSAYQLRADRTFPAARIDGMLVNFCTEVEGSRNLDIGFLKALISGDPVDVERKGRDPYTMLPTARFVFQTNNAPSIKDRSDGFWRRVLMVHFSRQFGPEERDPALNEKLVEELPGILNLALEGLRRLATRRRFDPSPAMLEALGEYQRECNPLAVWKEECLGERSGSHVVVSKAYAHYQVWCSENGHKAFSSQKFSKELIRLGLPKTDPQKINNKTTRVFRGWVLCA